MPLPKDPEKAKLWRKRQSIAQTGKKQSKEHIKNRRISLMTGLYKANTVLCASCGKELKRIPCRAKGRNYCNAKCQMNYEYVNKIRDPNEITKKAHIRTREMAREGIHPFQQAEAKIKSNRELGRRNYGKTWLEEKFGWMLDKLGIKAESQFPIKYGKDILDRDRYYFVDFAIPSIKLAIECDGEFWHKNKKKDNERQNRIEALGWKMLRFTGKEIKNNLFSCGLEIFEAIH